MPVRPDRRARLPCQDREARRRVATGARRTRGKSRRSRRNQERETATTSLIEPHTSLCWRKAGADRPLACPRGAIRRALTAPRWRYRGTQRVVARADQPRRRRAVPGRLHQPRRDDVGQTDLPSIQQTISAAARRRSRAVLRCLEQAYRIHSVPSPPSRLLSAIWSRACRCWWRFACCR
jgi:hypothetical protein